MRAVGVTEIRYGKVGRRERLLPPFLVRNVPAVDARDDLGRMGNAARRWKMRRKPRTCLIIHGERAMRSNSVGS